MRYAAEVGERILTLGVDEDGQERAITVDGRALTVNWQGVGDHSGGLDERHAGHFSLLIGERTYELYIRPTPHPDDLSAEAYEVTIGNHTLSVIVRDEHAQAIVGLAASAHIKGDVTIRAPMPGLVSNILATEGAAVERGQAVVVLEAMKMENDLTTPRTGVMKSLRVTKGQAVNQGDVLAVVGDPPGVAPEADEDDNGV